MKKITTMLFAILGMTTAYSQGYDDSAFAGDNFSLEGALEVFKKSNSLEEFEQRINEQDNYVNNLDLNNDGETDYIVVEDIQDNDTHVIVLSTYLNEYDKQDIATINIQKTGNAEAILEIIGDESLYDSNTIVEPYDIDNSQYSSTSSAQITVNVWLWPSIRFIYAPRYVVWVSPHRWAYYPIWWRPWRVYHHHVFYTRCAPHRVYYHRAPTHRVVVASRIYAPRRHTSALVVKDRRSTTVIRSNNRENDKGVRTYSPERRNETSTVRNNRAATATQNNRSREEATRTNTPERRHITSETRNNRGNEKAVRTQASERRSSNSAVKNNRVQKTDSKSNREQAKDRGNRRR
jgi:hypothetical protein